MTAPLAGRQRQKSAPVRREFLEFSDLNEAVLGQRDDLELRLDR
jgi:hypothetical protein